VQHAPGRSLDARREDRIRDTAAATIRPQAEACWAHQDHVRHQIRIERGHGQRCSGTNGDADNSDLLELQPAAEICQAHSELRRRRSGTDARPAISRAGGDEHRVAGFEKDLLAEPTTGRHMATVQDQHSGAAATLQPILDRVAVDSDHIRCRRLRHGPDSASSQPLIIASRD